MIGLLALFEPSAVTSRPTEAASGPFSAIPEPYAIHSPLFGAASASPSEAVSAPSEAVPESLANISEPSTA